MKGCLDHYLFNADIPGDVAYPIVCAVKSELDADHLLLAGLDVDH